MTKRKNKPLKHQYEYLKKRITEMQVEGVVQLSFYKEAMILIKAYEKD